MAEPESLLPTEEEIRRGVVRSLFGALRQRETYRFLRNRYFLFGFLWGVPIPVVTLGIHLNLLDLPPTWEGLVACCKAYPLNCFFLLHPVFFGVLFGAFGTVAYDQDRKIRGLLERLHTMAWTDGLTGLLNHRGFQERIRVEAARSAREAKPVSLLMIDLDHFKSFNDRFGHRIGDDLLCGVAKVLEELVRPYDAVCRYGGEEFTILLPNMSREEAAHKAEEMRAALASRRFEFPGFSGSPVTISIGVATRRPEEGIGSWIERADQRMYRAKAAGRNRICAGE